MLSLLTFHPTLCAVLLFPATVALSALWTALAAAIPAVLYGRYRGQAVSVAESVGFFVTAAAILLAPVVVLGVM
jgi:hypothetical protein